MTGNVNVGLLVSYLDDEYVEEVTHPHLSREYNGPQWPANPIDQSAALAGIAEVGLSLIHI